MSIDAVRGLAMICVAMAHVGNTYACHYSASLGNLLVTLGYFATPNFLLMSGLVAGYQLSRKHTAQALRRILERGLFILVVGHVLVTAATIYVSPGQEAIFNFVITDVIGVMLCMTPALRRLSSPQLILFGAILFTVSSATGFVWRPSGEWGQLVGAVLFDIQPVAKDSLTVAFGAYLGIFMLGMGIGPLISAAREQGRLEVLRRRLILVALAGIVVAIGANVAEHFLRVAYEGRLTEGNVLLRLLPLGDIRHKNPPTPAYFLFYVGLGSCLAGVFMRDTLPAVIRGPLGAAATIGRASFVSYVSQQWLITFVPIFFGFDVWFSASGSLIYLVLACIGMFLIATWWGRAGGNQYLFFSSVFRLNDRFPTQRVAP
jgi:hypothetical protein